MLKCFLTLFVVGLGATGCAAANADTSEDALGETGGTEDALSIGCRLTRTEILASVGAERAAAIRRGFSWFDRGVPYSQQRSFEGYRTDCSGFISMAWELGPSYTTLNFKDGSAENFSIGRYSDLKPGDALVRRSNGAGHVTMFVGWNNTAHTEACVLEQNSTALDMEFGARSVSSLQNSGYAATRADRFRNAN
jgi:cell wall-associated NlpC family hydrolase